MKKTIVSLLLALALVLCLSALAAPDAKAADDGPIQFHCKCGNKHSTALEDGEITWKEGTSACYPTCDGVILQWTIFPMASTDQIQPGNYYLPDNGAADGIALRSNTFLFGEYRASTGVISGANGVFNLDMNGNDLNMSGKSVRAFQVSYGATLNLCNSKTTGGNVTALGSASTHSGVFLLSNYDATTGKSDQTATMNVYGVSLKRLAGNSLSAAGAGRITSGCTLNAYDCQIVGGAVTTWGGTLDIEKNANVTLNNVHISGGNAVSNGGNIYCYGSLTMNGGSITGGVVTSTSGRHGGNLYSGGSASVNLNGVTISDGTATGNGGNICALAPIYLTDCTVSGGTSKWSGGNIYLDGGSLYATDCTVDGGETLGICTEECTSDCGHSTYYGGNIATSAGAAALQMTGCTVSNGISDSNAGNIYLSGSSKTVVKFEECEIFGGTAGSDGGNLWIGAIHAEAPTEAKTIIFYDCKIYTGQAQKGGSMVIARRVAINGGYVGTTGLKDSGDPVDGLGGKASVNGGNIFINNCELVLNMATVVAYGEAAQSGGNVYLGGTDAKLTMNKSSALRFGKANAPAAGQNTVAGGGNVFIREGTVIMQGNAKMDGGDALQCGGNVCVKAGYLQLGNNASIAGGGYSGLYGQSSMVPITAWGGNVYIADTGMLQMLDNSQIRNGACTNTGAQGGNILNRGEIIINDNAQVFGGLWSKTENRNIHQVSGSLLIAGDSKVDGGIVVGGGDVKLSGRCTVACYRTDADGEPINSGRTLYLAAGVVLDVSGLWASSNVQLYDLAPADPDGRLLATIAEAQDSDVKTRIKFAADSTQLVGYQITRERDENGVLGLYLRKNSAAGVREPNISNSVLDYATWEEAYAVVAEGGNIVLNQDIDGVTIDKSIVIDLRGFNMTNVTVAEGVTVYGADSSTHDYDTETGYGTLTLAADSLGTVAEMTDATEAQMGADRTYMTIEEEGVYSFHRYRADVVKISLRTGNKGFGYKFRFSGDQMVQERLSGFGIRLWIDGAEHVVTRTMTMDKFDSTKEFSLRLSNFDIELYGEIDVYAEGFLTLKEGGEITGDSVAYSMMTMLQKVTAALDSFTEGQILGIQGMLTEEEKAVMTEWGIDALLNWVASEEDETPEAPIV